MGSTPAVGGFGSAENHGGTWREAPTCGIAEDQARRRRMRRAAQADVVQPAVAAQGEIDTAAIRSYLRDLAGTSDREALPSVEHAPAVQPPHNHGVSRVRM